MTPAIAKAMPVPDIPFAVISGGRNHGKGYNPFLGGDNDGTLKMSETQLRGAADTLVIPAPHANISNHPSTIAATIRYLKSGILADDGGQTRADHMKNSVSKNPSPLAGEGG